MARKRFITSEMSTDERIASIAAENPVAALMWPWFITGFDDWGRMEAVPLKIKLSIFPAFPYAVEDIRQAIELYVKYGLVYRYEVNKKQYLAINPEKYYKYQTYIKGNKREMDNSNCPPPPNPPWENKEESEIMQDSEETLQEKDVHADERICTQGSADERICLPSPSPSPSLSCNNNIYKGLLRNPLSSFQLDAVEEKIEFEQDEEPLTKHQGKNKEPLLSAVEQQGDDEEALLPAAERMNTTKADKIPYAEIIDYLNAKAGTKYRSTTRSTREMIRARFAEKFTLDDFKTVIDKKCAEWLGTEHEKYLRPETLFCAKHFESYLNQKTCLTQKSRDRPGDKTVQPFKPRAIYI